MSEPSTRPESGSPSAHGGHTIPSMIAGRYKVEKLLGEGGMGAVFLVTHTAMRKRFALKVLHTQTAQLPEMAARFEREAMAAAHVEHPNITVATDFGKTEDGALFLVLEYLEGVRLRDALAQGPFEIRRAVHITRQIASALERSHELGIVHRDLKPENIMLVTRQGDRDFVKVLDFGLAKVADMEPGGEEPAQSLTKHGTIFGTPKYMAPEQCVAGPVDGRADLYALGLILFEMLTGVQAFSGKDALRTITLQLTTPMPTIRSVAPSVRVPESLEAVIRRLTEKPPENRYANATDLLAALAQVIEKEGLQSPVSANAVTPLGLASAAKEEVKADLQTVHSIEMITEPSQYKESPPPKQKAVEAELTTKDNSTPLGQAASAKESSTAKEKEEPKAAAPPAVHAQQSPAVAAPPSPLTAAPAKRTLDTLYRLHQGLPPPLRRIPLSALIAVCVVSVVLCIIILVSSSGDKPQGPDKAAGQGMVAAAVLEQATRNGIPGLVALAEEYPADPRIRRTIAQLHLGEKKGLEALRWMGKAALIDSAGVSEEDVRQATALAMTAPESVDEVVTLLETDLGAIGADVLYSLATRPGLTKAKQIRFFQSLSKASVRAHASPSLAVTLDLRSTNKCEAKRSLLKRAAEVGDQRTIDQLKPLTVIPNCGPIGLLDCWPCLHNDKQLTDTIAAILARIQTRK